MFKVINKPFFFLSLFVFSVTGVLYCDGTTGAPILNFYPSSRLNALGGSGVSVAGDFSMASVNPALLGTLRTNTASALFYNAFMDAAVAYLAFSKKTSGGSLSLETLGYFGGEITIDDSAGRHTGMHGKTLTAQRDLVFSAGYGNRLFTEGLYGGVKLKYYSSVLLEEYTASAFALDGGCLIKTTLFKTGNPYIYNRIYSPGLRLGFSVMNAGSGVSYTKAADKDPLPLTLRGGISCPVRFSEEHAVLVAGDVTHETNQDITRGGFGFEYINRDMFFLRAGYRLNYEIKHFTWGLGAIYGRFGFDYGMGLSSAINTEHMFIVSVRI